MSTIARKSTVSEPVPPPAGPRHNAISFVSSVVIGVASTAPAYSLAATLGVTVAVGGIGLQTRAIMLVAFVPMLFIAAAHYWMDRADPDCGTTSLLGDQGDGAASGLLGRLGIIAADVLVMPSRPTWRATTRSCSSSCTPSSSTGDGTPACGSTRSQGLRQRAGTAAIVSTLLLVAIYVVVTTAAQAFAGTKTLAANPTTSSCRSEARCSAVASTSC